MVEHTEAPIPLESEVQRALIQVARRDFGVVLWRNNSRVFMVPGKGGKQRPMRAGLGKGSSDLIGILPPLGRFLGVEVKRPGEVPTDEQRAWLDQVREMGGIGFWASHVWMLEAILKTLLAPGGYQLTVRVNEDSSQDIISRWTGEVLR